MSRGQLFAVVVILAEVVAAAGCGSGTATNAVGASSTTLLSATMPSTAGASASATTATSTTASTLTTTTASPPTTTVEWPEQIQAVMGLSATLDSTANSVWRVAGDEVITRELPYVPYEGCKAIGELASTFVFSEVNTGRVCVWHPGAPSPDDLSALDLPEVGSIFEDKMALSPDERLLALARPLPAPGRPDSSDATVTRGYLVDLDSGTIDSWDWLDSAAGAEIVTELKWGKTSNSVYVSIGYHGGSQGDWSYRYDVSTGEAAELKGVATVLDVGLQDQVVGLGMPASPEEFEYPAGPQYGVFPLVLWQNGERVILPRDPSVVSWDSAWISDDGRTIVVYGTTEDKTGRHGCLEVLKLHEARWEVGGLFIAAEYPFLVAGGSFEPNSSTLWFEAGSGLYELDTDTDQAHPLPQVTPSITLPGSPGYYRGVGIAWTECRGGT